MEEVLEETNSDVPTTHHLNSFKDLVATAVTLSDYLIGIAVIAGKR